jgi:hypothetical protein
MEWVALMRLTVGLILLSAALAKAWSLSSFEAAIANYDLVPKRYHWAVARIVVLAELIVSGLLLAGWQPGVASVGAAGLLLAFAGAVAINLRRKRTIDCGCLGRAVELRMGWLSTAATGLLGVSLLVTFDHPGLRVLFPIGVSSINASTRLVLVTAALLLAITYWLIAYAQYVTELIEDALGETTTVEVPR